MKKFVLTLSALLLVGTLTSCNQTVEKYMVSFDSKGGTFIKSLNINNGEKVTKPEDPVRNLYTFKGWYLNDEPYNFDSLVNSDIILVAKWEENLPEAKASFTFQSDYCYVSGFGEDETIFPMNQELTFSIKLKNDYVGCYSLPKDVEILIGTADRKGTNGQDYNYSVNGDVGTLKITLTENYTKCNVRYTDSDNIYRITESQFNAAVDMNDVQYVQREYKRIIYASVLVDIVNMIDYISPNINYYYCGYLQSSMSTTVNFTERYYSFEEGHDYCYEKDESGKWEKKDAYPSEHKKSSDLSPRYILNLGGVTYDSVKDKYDESLNAYIFTTDVTSGSYVYTYEVSFVFICNKLINVTYSNLENRMGESSSYTYTYGEHTPTLPTIS